MNRSIPFRIPPCRNKSSARRGGLGARNLFRSGCGRTEVRAQLDFLTPEERVSFGGRSASRKLATIKVVIAWIFVARPIRTRPWEGLHRASNTLSLRSGERAREHRFSGIGSWEPARIF